MTRFEYLPDLPAGATLEALLDLLALVFDDQDRAAWLAELRYQQARGPVQLWLAWAEGQVVGCKLGYERKPGHYYSWLGAVRPERRGQGLASALMEQQHQWCRRQGYRRLRTQTYNRWRSMLILNLRHGFEVVGTCQGAHGLMIVLEKELLPVGEADERPGR
ncbi:GNAT family N-acetyltransferase [Hymenobacter sp. B81]|uniref:GNAT family N-acetyltransferase n=1 Tax=Hymenobacter sp. B81 TaxID=3344878 RepID=UPI0037DDCD6C